MMTVEEAKQRLQRLRRQHIDTETARQLRIKYHLAELAAALDAETASAVRTLVKQKHDVVE